MNDKITFPRLASMLSDRSVRSKRFSEDFLREFFALLSERLEAGDSVKIKGLGTFKLSRVEPRRSVDVTTGQPMEISGHSKVVFIPAKELAEAVNAPFEAFSAIEISDDADLSLLFSKDEIELQDVHDDSIEEAEIEPKESLHTGIITEKPEEPMNDKADIPSPSPADSTAIIDSAEAATRQETTESNIFRDNPHEELIESDSESTTASSNEKAVIIEEETAPEPRAWEEEAPEESARDEQTTSDIAEEEYGYDIAGTRKKNWIRTLMISLGAALFALVATFGIWYFFATNDFGNILKRTASNTDTAPTEGFVVGNSTASVQPEHEPIFTDDTVTDTLAGIDEEVPTAPSDPLVYDTISTTRYLTTMAKAHYGNYNLWPYIYEENKAILGHPDRIRPGTPVVIPRLSKLGIDPTNSDDIEKAKKMGTEIYSRYGKKF